MRIALRPVAAIMAAAVVALLAPGALASAPQVRIKAPKKVRAQHAFNYTVRGKTDATHRQVAFAIDGLRCAATYAEELTRPGAQDPGGFRYAKFRPGRFALQVHQRGNAVAPGAGSEWVCVYVVNRRTQSTLAAAAKRFRVIG